MMASTFRQSLPHNPRYLVSVTFWDYTYLLDLSIDPNS